MDDADPRLEGSTEPIYDPIRGKASSAVNPIAGYTKICTPSGGVVPFGQRVSELGSRDTETDDEGQIV